MEQPTINRKVGSSLQISELDVIKQFNNQWDRVAQNVALLTSLLVPYSESQMEPIEQGQISFIKKALKSFDVYVLIDFMEHAEIQKLQDLIMSVFYRFLSSPYKEIQEILAFYLSVCENKLTILDYLETNSAKNDNISNCYQLFFRDNDTKYSHNHLHRHETDSHLSNQHESRDIESEDSAEFKRFKLAFHI